MQSESRRSPSSSLTLPLLILTAQQRSIIANLTDSKLIKFIATMYDRCQVRCTAGYGAGPFGAVRQSTYPPQNRGALQRGAGRGVVALPYKGHVGLLCLKGRHS